MSIVEVSSVELDAQYTDIQRLHAEANQWKQRADTAETHIGQVLYLLCAFGQTDGAPRKAWVIDQIARELLGGDYDKWIASQKADGLTWDTGVQP
jgi:hypothetical protein